MNVITIIEKSYKKLAEIVLPRKMYARFLGVKIGKNCMVARGVSWPTEPYLVTIGNNVQITHCVSIHTHGGGNSVRRLCPKFDVFGKVVIKDWAYIGAYSQIMPGVTIGEGALVAAGSIVTKSVAPNMVVGGNPAKVICTTEEYLQRNNAYNLNTKGMDYARKRKLLLGLPESKLIKK